MAFRDNLDMGTMRTSQREAQVVGKKAAGRCLAATGGIQIHGPARGGEKHGRTQALMLPWFLAG